MALVAYDNSDSSEFEDDDSEPATAAVVLNKKVEVPEPAESKPIVQNGEASENQSLFNLLPRPTNKKPSVLEEDDEFLHKKENGASAVKPKAKISVPSLSDEFPATIRRITTEGTSNDGEFSTLGKKRRGGKKKIDLDDFDLELIKHKIKEFRDVEDSVPAMKPKKMNGKKSGLLSMLPQPRNAVIATTKSLIPHVLTQKPKPSTTTAKQKQPLPPIKKNQPDSLAIDYSDDSDNEEVQNDFFSINKPVELPDDIPLDIDQKTSSKKVIHDVNDPSTQKQPRDIESYFKAESESQVQEDYSMGELNAQYGHSDYSNGYPAAEGSNTDVALDEEAILKLCGTRGKRKREDIQIVDVNQQEVLAEARQWLVKGLMDDTSKRASSSKRRGNEPTTQQRRKHQITYLAHQAKANEVELQNQWANNRMSKRQTQSKYGF